ncbi:MAG: hypothetical protein PQJ46_09330 [Spirochaetales bacterium]|nr:hypothetical protein [Spirochaetales bacterium]
MKIDKFIYKGQKVDYDIHFKINNKICRYGSNEDPKPELSKSIFDLSELVSEKVQLTSSIMKISFTYKADDILLTVECKAATVDGDLMKITLPKFGYRNIVEVNIKNGQLSETKKPIRTTMAGINIIDSLTNSLIDYIQNGNGQLQLDFQNDEQPKILEFVR